VSKESGESKSEDSEEPDNIDAENKDLGDYNIIFQDLSVVDATAVNLSNLTRNKPREINESFRDYVSRRVRRRVTAIDRSQKSF
jgi:hypothetical protein